MNHTSRIGIVGILKLDGVYEVWNEIIEMWKSLCYSWIEKYERDCLYLWTASFYGHTDLLKRMISCNPAEFAKYLNQGRVDYLGKTALAVAVERDNYETARILIESGADEDIPDFCLNRPLHLVKSEKMAELLKYHEKPNAAELTAIEIAVEEQRIEVVKYFISNCPTVSLKKLLLAAAKAKSDKSIDFLTRHYVIKTFESDLLMKSIENGSYEVFKYLIRKGCAIPENGLEVGRTVGNVGILRYLEKHAAKENE